MKPAARLIGVRLSLPSSCLGVRASPFKACRWRLPGGVTPRPSTPEEENGGPCLFPYIAGSPANGYDDYKFQFLR